MTDEVEKSPVVEESVAPVAEPIDVQKDDSLRFARVLFKIVSITTLLAGIAVIATTLIRCFV